MKWGQRWFSPANAALNTDGVLLHKRLFDVAILALLRIFYYTLMRQYVIDELRLDDYEKIKAWMDETYGPPSVPGIYWIPVDDALLSEVQAEHTTCRPFYFTIELEQDHLSCELLIRTRKTLKCDCMAYASKEQRDWIIQFADTIFERQGVVF